MTHDCAHWKAIASQGIEVERILRTEIERLRIEINMRRLECDKAIEKIDHLADALHQIDNWSRAYPVSVFAKPDLPKAHRLLAAGGMSLDAISADAMRHVVEGVGTIARKALKILSTE